LRVFLSWCMRSAPAPNMHAMCHACLQVAAVEAMLAQRGMRKALVSTSLLLLVSSCVLLGVGLDALCTCSMTRQARARVLHMRSSSVFCSLCAACSDIVCMLHAQLPPSQMLPPSTTRALVSCCCQPLPLPQPAGAAAQQDQGPGCARGARERRQHQLRPSTL
jgi:hypothetical protein